MSEDKLNINQWAEEDRPREKLMRLGAGALTNAELMALLLGSGWPKDRAAAVPKGILDACADNLHKLGRMSTRELQEYNGMGAAKAVIVQETRE